MTLGNTAVRIIVSLIFIPLIIAVVLYGKLAFLVFATFIGIGAFYEFFIISKAKKNYIDLPVGAAASAALIFNAYFHFTEYSLIIMISSLLLLIIELFRVKESALNNLGGTLLGIFYIGLFASTLVNIRELFAHIPMMYDTGGYIILAMLITIWTVDSGAFFVGSAIGRTRLYPRISPKKSWEGAIGGFMLGIGAMLACHYTFLDFISVWQSVIIGVIIGTAGQIGDLVESMIKRDSGVKDSSGLIPGHGGLMDRFDSVFFCAPVIYIYLKYFVL